MPLSSFSIEDILRSNDERPCQKKVKDTQRIKSDSIQHRQQPEKGDLSNFHEKKSFLWDYITSKTLLPSCDLLTNLETGPSVTSSSPTVSQAKLKHPNQYIFRPRRLRTVYTDMQLTVLEERFIKQKYLSTPDRIKLAKNLALTQLQVKTWYQNRRMRWKKSMLCAGKCDAIQMSSLLRQSKGRPKKDANPSCLEV